MGRTGLLSPDSSLASVILWSALAVAMLFLALGCSAISSGSSHESDFVSGNWQADGTYMVDEASRDSTVELLRDLFSNDKIVSSKDMPPEMVAHYTRRCQTAYGLQSGYAAEIHKGDTAQFMCFKMHYRLSPSVEMVCKALNMKPVKGGHKDWKFSCVPNRI